MSAHLDSDHWLLPSEVASYFGVKSNTISRWVNEGRFINIRMKKTAGGHHRFYLPDIENLVNTQSNQSLSGEEI